MEKQICSYRGCNELVNSPHDDTLCVFHAPVEKKGITVGNFNDLIFDKITEITEHNEQVSSEDQKKEHDFRGFIFPGRISFRDLVFSGYTIFTEAQFSGDAIFTETPFSENVIFIGARFSGRAQFSEARFSGRAQFSEARFSRNASFYAALFSEDANFSKTQFSGNTSFSRVQFSRVANFAKAQFSEYTTFYETRFFTNVSFLSTRFSGYAYFLRAQFSGYTDFFETQFSGIANFIETQFLGDAEFIQSRFDDSGLFEKVEIKKSISYVNITLAKKARFYFEEPKFIPEKGHTALVTFDDVRFNPFAVFFENIQYSPGDKNRGKNLKAVLIFRYCQLKDVYFTNNDMSLFSFYKSSFDEARFISCRWSDEKDRVLFFPFRRKNVIPEERFLLDSADKEKFMIEDLNGYEDIASLYRRMKTALDNTKDYQQASWFYFNEFEMKRRALEEEIENSLPKWRVFRWRPMLWFYRQLKKIFSKYVFYFSYKVFAGFGEKPWWSFIWFWVITIIFAFGHMVFGLEYFPGGVVETKYEFFGFLKHFDVISFLKEFGNAFGYAVTQAIPKNYIPYKLSNLNPTNPFGIVWSITNTVTLWILIIFIGIGLKRHFRRF